MMRMQSRLPLAAAGSLLTQVWCCVLALLSGMTAIAHADHPITVSGTSNLSFGTLFRNSTSSVTYSSANAARFTVTGTEQRWVLLAVTFNALITGNGGGANQTQRVLTPTVATVNCQYSTDGGTTWRSFSSTIGNSAWVLTKFPNGPGTTGTIRVRVGASVTSSVSQQRGNYSGSVRLIASYTSDDDDDGNHGHGNDDDHDDDDNPGHWWDGD